ncbi:hypothetical protein LL912_00895 [Niabella sp. CC-SYL272]|uniref:hypothetical protein n=1 Tax=Niabella agricola TaxID=2891571 RepID=UPI001F415204|nr:hypothetical protein [Niabella agricola]MCF3107324.1 hypothetical protein [Niabella agricola]
MAWKPFYGLKKIEIGVATTNNTAPTVLTEVPFTKVDTAVYSKEADSFTDIPIEESEVALERLKSQTGPRAFRWTTYSNDFSLKAMLEGGTYTAGGAGVGDKYSPPEAGSNVKLYVKMTDKFNKTTEIFNASIEFVENSIQAKSGLPEWQIAATATAVGAGFKSVIETQPPAA